MALNYTLVGQLEAILESLTAAKGCETSAESIQQPEPLDEAAIKTSLRNQVLAGSGVKAAFWGTLSTPPTVTAADLQAAGLSAAAASQIIAERDRLRAFFLGLLGG